MDVNTTSIILGLIALVAAVAGVTVIVRVVVRNRSNTTKTKQTDNVVFGDQAGRDIKK